MTQEALKKIVKDQLWGWNIKAKDVSQIPGVEYDLLADEKLRVKVMESVVKTAEAIRTFKDCDVLAIVVRGEKTRYAMGVHGKNGDVTFAEYHESPKPVFRPSS